MELKELRELALAGLQGRAANGNEAKVWSGRAAEGSNKIAKMMVKDGLEIKG